MRIGPKADEPEVGVPVDRHDDAVGLLADLPAEPVDAKRVPRAHARAHANARRDRLDTAHPQLDHVARVVGPRVDGIKVP
jgi:hypothetical protein